MVIWADPAKHDLHLIHDYIAQTSPYYAKKVIQNIVDKTKILNQHSKIGKVVPEINNNNIRQLSLYSYRLFYEISDDQIVILAIIHKRRDFKADELET